MSIINNNNYQPDQGHDQPWIKSLAIPEEQQQLNRQHFQQELAARSWLKEGHPMGDARRMDFKKLCLLAGDSFIKGTDYEGGDSAESLSFLHDFFKNTEHDEITRILENSLNIANLMNGDYVEFASQISKHTAEDLVWFPTGWTDQTTSSHAVMLGINSRDNSVTIFNMGAGINFHGQTDVFSMDPTTGQPITMSKDQGFYKITHCDPEKLRSPQLYQFLYEMKNKHKADPDLELNADKFYKGLQKHLNGKVEANLDPEKNPLCYRKKQRSGTCSVKSTLTAIYYYFASQNNVAEYKHLKFKWQSQALVTVMRKGIKPEQKYLIQNLIENMARAVNKEPLRSTITEDEKLGWEATLLDIQERLSKISDSIPPDTDIRTLQVEEVEALHRPSNPKGYGSGGNNISEEMEISKDILVFKPVSTESHDYSELSISELLEKVKVLVKDSTIESEHIGEIYELFALIVKKAKEDPAAKLDGFSINIDSLEEHLANPYTVYLNKNTHQQLKKAVKYFRGLGKENRLFVLEEGKIVVSAEKMKMDPTLQYLSQFLDKNDNTKNRVEAVHELLMNTDELPESFRAVFHAWLLCNSLLFAEETTVPKAELLSRVPLELAVDFNFTTDNKSDFKKYFEDPNYKTLTESTSSQNQLVSGVKIEGNFSQDNITNRNLHMIGLDFMDVPNRIVAFFSKNIDILSEKGMCAYVLSQLFRPMALVSQIEAQPQSAEKLKEFCKNAVGHFIQKGDYDTALSCILMTQRIQAFLKDDFLDCRVEILERLIPLSRNKTSAATRVDLLELVLTEISSQEDPQYDVDLATYMFTCVAGGIKPNSFLAAEYAERINSIEKNPAVKVQILQFLGLEQGDYILDFEGMVVVNEDKTPVVSLPDAIKSHPFFLWYFNGCEVSWKQEGSTCILRSNDKILTAKLDPSLGFYRTFNGEEYRYKGPGGALVEIPGTLWESVNNKNINILFDNKNDQPSIQYFSLAFNVEEIARLSDNATFIPKHTIPQRLTNIWVDTKYNIQEFKYEHLKFVRKNVDNEDRLYCEQHPGYYLVENCLSDKFTYPYITLKNMAGQYKVIIENKWGFGKKEDKFSLVECSITPEGSLDGVKLDDKLFLIKHLLEKNEHNTAARILRELNCLERLDDDEKKSRWEISNLNALFRYLKDKKHPNAQAIYLLLVKLDLENRMKYPGKVGTPEKKCVYTPKQINEILSAYLKNETNSTTCRLTAKEKLRLMQVLEESYPKEFNVATVCSDWQGRIISAPQQKKKKEGVSIEPVLEAPTNNFVCNGLVFSEDYFSENYSDLHHLASNGTKAEKDWLGAVLDFNFSYYNESRAFTLIYNHYIHPRTPQIFLSLFESIKMIAKMIKDLFVGQKRINHVIQQKAPLDPTPLVINIESMESADRAFGKYFKEVIEGNFSCQDVPQEEFDAHSLPHYHDSKLVNAKLQNEREDLEYFRTEVLKPHQDIRVTNIDNLKTSLSKTASQLSERLKAMKTALLWKINSGDSFKKIGLSRNLEWIDLQRLSLAGDFESFRKATSLKADEAEMTLSSIGYYLVLESRLDQMQNVLKLLGRAEKEGLNTPRGILLTTQSYETLSLFTLDTRFFEKMNRLWFECANKYLYRKEQIDKLNEILKEQCPEVQAEMPTGYGKTKGMVPTLSEEVSKQGKAVVNCWPATLEMTNIADMDTQMKNSFGKNVDRLTFDRSSKFTSNNLAVIYRALCDDKENGRPINCCPEAIRALELHFILTLDSSIKNEEINKKLKYFRKILYFFKNESWATIDEEHVLLSPMDRLIYTLGKAVPLNEYDVNTIEKLFEFLLEIPGLDLSQKPNHVMSDEAFQIIANTLANQFYDYWNCKEARHEFIDFVTGENEQEPHWLATHPQKEEISLLKGSLCFILQTALAGSVDENFGLSHLHFDTTEFAISYSSSNTPKETPSAPSQFKNPHETLTKTYLTYLYKGLDYKQFNKLIRDLQEKQEAEASQGVSLAGTEANKFFESFGLNYAKPLAQLELSDIYALHEVSKKNKDVVLYYIKTQIVPQIKIYEESITSDAQNFRSQFSSSLSLSATPQHKYSHGPKTVFIPMKGTSGQVTHLLLTKCKNPESIHRMQGTNPDQATDWVASKIKGRSDFKAVIDIGAHFKGKSNNEIAQKLLQEDDPDVMGVLFFDENDGTFKILNKQTGCVLDYAAAEMTPEERRTCYDQSRCFGSDIPQACDAVALMLTSETNTKAQIGQAAGRMRQLKKGQTIEVGVPEQMSEQQNIQDLLVYWIANQAEQEAFLNYNSQLQQYDNFLRSALLDEMIDPNNSIYSVNYIFEGNREIFITKESFSSYEQYARTPKFSKTETVLQNKKDQVASRIRENYNISSAVRTELLQELDDAAARELLVPEKVAANAGLGMETEVLQEVEINVELELENQNVNQNPVSEQKPIIWNDNIDIFEKGWERSGSIFPIFRRIMSAFIYGGSLTDEIIIRAKKIEDFSRKVISKELFATIVGAPLGTGLAYLAFTVLGIAYTALDGVASTFIIYNILLLISLGITNTVWIATGIMAGLSAMISAVAIAALVLAPIAIVTSLAVRKITIHFAKKYHADNFISRVDEIMQVHLQNEANPCHEIFSPHFYATNNFFRQNSYDMHTEQITQPQVPFGIDQKPIFEVMLIEDTDNSGSKQLKMVAIDSNDSPFFRKKLLEDAETPDAEANRRGRKVAIYDLANEIIVANGKNSLLLEDLKLRPEFHELLASAKFMNGETSYTDQELAYLQGKINTIGKTEVKNFFVNNILRPFRARNLRCLKTQPIGRLLA